ncbi:hypothetical protein CON53_10820 [Bacillus cereus]|uniref:hypothetical protein n=1 Tax=Bacillus cereus group TaxID=86661 RepID=UPI000BEBFF42|nr:MULTISPECIES: hypothetical protein [Bacillus cereus group]PEE18092.1 hypothetical protein CON53_10820 [Bacillus cereus]PGP20055.1 hypothetical protein COA01_20255 [Bacillus cereus]PHB62629.1 hypothetical protein COE87_13970 [Bacillus wiedmannii]
MTEIKDRDKHYKRQKFVQLVVYLFEVFFLIFTVLTICSYIDTGSIFGWLKGISAYDFLDKIITIFTLHTLAVFAYVRLKLSARDDAFISIDHVISHALNMCKYNIPPQKVLERCNEFKESTKGKTYMLNKEDIRIITAIENQIEGLINQTISIKEFEYNLESLKIDLNFALQSNNLAWTNSFFLNWVK